MEYKMFFDGDFSKESIMELLAKMDAVAEDERYGKVRLYFSSPGGRIDLLYMLIEYVEDYPLELEIVVNGLIGSAGLFFVLMTEANISVTPLAMGLAHMTDVTLSMRELRDKRSTSTVIMESSEIDDMLIGILKDGGMPKKDLEKIKDGYDVTISKQELVDMLMTLMKKREEYRIKAAIEDNKAALEELKLGLKMIKEI